MNFNDFNNIPVWLLVLLTTIIAYVAVELGYRFGKFTKQKTATQKETVVSTITVSILSLMVFMLVFTFSITANKFEYRKALVREEANAIGTTYLRASFLPEPDRSASKQLLKKYLDIRIKVTEPLEFANLDQYLVELTSIQQQLWKIAATNANKGINAPIIALYIQSLNNVIDLHTLRVTVGLHTQIPLGIWIVLYAIFLLSMIEMGYYAAITNSGKTKLFSAMILALAIVIGLLISLDRASNTFIKVPQKALTDLQAFMEKDL